MKRTYHRCGGCGRKLPLDKAPPYYCSIECHEARKAKARAYAKKYYDQDPERYRERTKNRRMKSPEKVRASQKRWRESNPETVRANRVAWASANKEKLIAGWRRWVARNPEKNRAKVKAWQLANPERYKAQCHAKRVRDRTTGTNYTAAEWRERLEEFDHACAYCASASVLSVDHVVAISRGGTNDIDNIVPACFRCNSSKKASEVREWLVRMRREGMELTPFARSMLAGVYDEAA